MADIVTTLKSKSGDNIYPIAGGMINDSVSTAMLKDSAVTTAKIAGKAVTSDNIDWTTFPVKAMYAGEGSITDIGSTAWHFVYVSVPAGVFTTTPIAVASYRGTGTVPPSIAYIKSSSSPTSLVFGVWSNTVRIDFSFIAVEI